MNTSASSDNGPAMLRLNGVDHLASVTWKPRETHQFYTEAMRMPLVHAITATGWVTESYPDFVHFFFDMGRGNRLAFFYFFGIGEDDAPSDLMRRSRHLAFNVATEDELHQWRAWLKALGIRVTHPLAHELIESIYFNDPNGIQLEITRSLRPFAPIDERDAELTLQALVDVVDEPEPTAQALWKRKAELIQKRNALAIKEQR
jgi:catechol 2,3-dioxygenase-like lactoylglutathione lyase family enzyme